MEVKIGPYSNDGSEREIRVQIDHYDVWNMDYTLSLLIVPMLEMMVNGKHGSPFVDNEDVPEELRGCGYMDDGSTDEHWHDRWNYVLKEMLWGFEQIRDNTWCMDRDEKRIANATRLFGKYYSALWT